MIKYFHEDINTVQNSNYLNSILMNKRILVPNDLLKGNIERARINNSKTSPKKTDLEIII